MAVKILHTSDWHVGRRIRGRDRSDEHRAVLDELVGIADDNKVDLTLVAGDVFDTSSPAPVSEEIVWKTLLDLAAIAPVAVIGGNHDNQRRLDAVAPLLERAGVAMVGAPKSRAKGGLIDLDDAGIRVAMLPFVSQRGIVKAEHIMSYEPDQHAGAFDDRLRQLVELLTEEMTTDTVNILMSHLTVYGAVAGGGERQAHIFGYAIPASAFPGHLSYVALGHLHRQQKMPHSGAVWYSGSPLQLDFGEVDDAKGVLLVEAEPGLPAKVTSVPLNAGKRLATLTGTLAEVASRADEVADAYVKVVLTESARVGLADEVRSVIPGAVDILLQGADPVRQTREPRQSLQPQEGFKTYLEERGSHDERVESLFAELLDEVSV